VSVMQVGTESANPSERFAAVQTRLRAQDRHDTALARSKRQEAKALKKAKVKATAVEKVTTDDMGVRLGWGEVDSDISNDIVGRVESGTGVSGADDADDAQVPTHTHRGLAYRGMRGHDSEEDRNGECGGAREGLRGVKRGRGEVVDLPADLLGQEALAKRLLAQRGL
jgi:hypothetical protein